MKQGEKKRLVFCITWLKETAVPKMELILKVGRSVSLCRSTNPALYSCSFLISNSVSLSMELGKEDFFKQLTETKLSDAS